MVKKSLLVAVALVAVAALAWVATRSGGDARAVRPEASITPPARDTIEETRLDAPADEERGAEPERVAVEPEASGEAAADGAHPRSLVFGLVTDIHGRPLAGVHAKLSCNGRWVSEDLHPEEIDTPFEMVTDSDGRFEFDTPTPTSDWVMLRLSVSEYFDNVRRNFGVAGGRNEKPLHPGDNDLGTFVLRPTGIIEGIVRAAAGGPIPGAGVSLNDNPGPYVRSAKVGEDGHYRLGHVPLGTFGLTARAKGYVNANHGAVEVREGDVTAGVDFMLERAPILAGRVVDEAGAPLVDVRLFSWPASYGSGAGARSAADGSFTIHLPQDEPYTLEAKLSGFAEWNPGRSVVHAPGTTGIEVVMRRQDLTTFIVLAAETGEPVERFGLKVIRVRTVEGWTISGSSHQMPAPLEDHPGGEARLAGEPGFFDYTIVAPGFAAQHGPVDFDEVGVLRQTIYLGPGAVLTGRFVLDGEPVPSPTVRIEDGDDEFTGRLQILPGRPDGTFRIEDLATGSYDLELIGGTGAPLVVRGVELEVGRTTDLGDLEGFQPGAIDGLVVLPSEVSVAGLRVMLGDEHFGDREKAVTTGTDGRFRFDGLGEGTHYVHVEEKQGVLVRGKGIPVELERGEERSVIIDLGDRVPCSLRVTVRVNGEPEEGAQVWWVATNERRSEGMGTTNAEGVFQRSVEARAECWIEARSKGGLLIGRAERKVTLEAGGSESLELDFQAGSLTLKLPTADVERRIPGFLVLTRLDAELVGSMGHVQSSVWRPDGAGLRADLGSVQPGEWRVKLSLGQSVFEGDVRVEAGHAVECALVEADRP